MACHLRLKKIDLITVTADGCLLLVLAVIELLIEHLVIVKLLAYMHVVDIQVSQLIVGGSRILASILADADLLFIRFSIMAWPWPFHWHCRAIIT